MSLSYSIWPQPAWQTPHSFAHAAEGDSNCLNAATNTSSAAGPVITSFAANWRLEGGQYLPHIPGELANAGTPQICLIALLNSSFLPCWLCFPTDAPRSEERRGGKEGRSRWS